MKLSASLAEERKFAAFTGRVHARARFQPITTNMLEKLRDNLRSNKQFHVVSIKSCQNYWATLILPILHHDRIALLR